MITLGGGNWSALTYSSVTGQSIRAGTTFGYSGSTSSKSRTEWKAHELLDPKRVNNDGDHKDKNIRESLDSTEHPTVTSIAVGLDVTGSNISQASIIQKKLPLLLGTVMRKGLIEHPQISIGAMGDANMDRVPLQFAPFESDNRLDDHIDNMFLEGGGGGNWGESYGLYLYYLAHHTYLDSWERRGKKGYAFLLADERTLVTTPHQIREFIGDTHLENDLQPEEAFRLAEEKYEVFLLDTNASYQDSLSFYRDILGERAIDITGQSEDVPEIIASLVRAFEGDDLDDIDSDLAAVGASTGARKAVGKALAAVGAPSGGSVAVSESPEDLDEEDDAERL